MRIKLIGMLLTTLFMINSVTADGVRGFDTGFIGAPIDCDAINSLSPEYQKNCEVPGEQETIVYSYVDVKDTYYVNGVKVEIDAKYQMMASTNPLTGAVALIKITNVKNEFTIICPNCTINEMQEYINATAQDFANNRIGRVVTKLYEAGENLLKLKITMHDFKNVVSALKELVFPKGLVFVEDGQGNLIGLASFQVYNIDFELDTANVEIKDFVELRSNGDPLLQNNGVGLYDPFDANGNLIKPENPLIRVIPGYDCRWVRVRLPEGRGISSQRVCGVWK